MVRKFLLGITFLVLVISAGFLCHAAGSEILWTDEEREFLENHSVIQLGIDPAFIPFEFIDSDGQYKGITADYIKLLEKKTGLEMVVVENLTWTEAYEKALSGDIDVLPALSKTYEREQQFLFSEPYYDFKRVIVTRDDNSNIKGIEDLKGKTIAIQRNSSHHSYLMGFPNINLNLYDSVEVALTSVANGTEIAFVGNIATTNYLIRSTGLTNLKFVAFEAEKSQAIYFGVRKDWPELVSILNKAIGTITQEEKSAINNRWIDLKANIDYGPIIRILLIVGSFVLAVWLVSIYWIFRLRKEVEQRKIIQKDLELAKKEAEVANNVKSSFLARMSHEIRTPLNAIIGMSYLLKKTELSLTQKTYAQRITQASNNMLSIVNDILDFSKIEAGKVEIESVSFSLDQSIQEVVNIVSYKLEEQKIQFSLKKDPQIPNWFYGDSKRIEQVLLNLINNATKFTLKGEISLDIKLLSKENDKCNLSFTINDTGIGMSELQIQQLFKPFSQGDASINRRFGGTGLGLSIVKNLLDMMNGDIQVYSTQGEGSTFIVRLDLEVDVQKEESDKQQVPSAYFESIKTLVLEKKHGKMNVIDSYLRAFGMNCQRTTSQVSAVSILETAQGENEKPYDLLIVDYDSPLEKGFDFIEGLYRNKNIVRMAKVIMLLPMMRADLFDKLDEHGIAIGIGKPIIPSVLFNGILEIFKFQAVLTTKTNVISDKKPIETVKNSYSVLVVEDNKTNQLIAKSLLTQANFSLWMAENGQEGVSIFKEHYKEIDLVLMDLHMPVMDGYCAATELLKISWDVPIVAMTADVIQGVKEKCKEHGIHYYISKPFDPELFIETIYYIIQTTSGDKDKDLEILDRDKGMKMMGNRRDLYEKVLEEFFRENLETAERLNDAIHKRDYEKAAQICHKIKSSLGSIGAVRLYNVSIELYQVLKGKREEEITHLSLEFNELLGKVLMNIKDSMVGHHKAKEGETV